MTHPSPATVDPSPALNAFLRGIERRGAVFASLQCGSVDAGDRALLSAMRAFRGVAASLPVAEWPPRFWALLLAAPDLRHVLADASWPEQGLQPLAVLGRGPRAALLLRLVAGLSEVDAAGVLGIARPTYRIALQRALPHGDDGRPDADAWRALGDAAQRTLRDLGVERLAHLARLREAALHARRLEPMAAKPPPVVEQVPALAVRRRWMLPAIAAVSTACVIALAATFLLPLATSVDGATDNRVSVEPLPPAEPAAAVFDADAALVTHPDFDQVLAQQAGALSREPGLYAWLAAGSPPPRIDREQVPDPSDAGTGTDSDTADAADPNPTDSDAADVETSDAPR